MSDEVSLRCTDREVVNLVFANAEIREPAHPYQMQWMARWSQASSNNGRFSMPNSRNNLDSFYSESKLPVSSMNLENFAFCQFQNSTGLYSEQNHFPMMEINRSIQSIVAPKKKMTSFHTAKAKMNEHVLPLRVSPMTHQSSQFASEGHQRRQNISGTCKGINQHEREEGLPHYNYSENDLYYSGLAFKEHFANANLSYFKQGLYNGPKNSTVAVSEMKNNDLKFSGSSRARLKNGPSSCPDDVPRPFLTEESNKQGETVFGRNRSVLVLREPKRKREEVEGSAVSAKVKGTAFFEKLTVPAMLYHHGRREESLQALVSSTNDIEAVDHTDAQFMMKEDKNLVETDSKHIDVNEPLSSPEVGNTSESYKVPQEYANPKTKASALEDSNSARTESVDAPSKKCSNPPTESTERDWDPSSKWVHRLRPNLLDSIPLSTKRFKKGDCSSSEMGNLLSRVVNYNRTISDFPEPSRVSVKEIPWIRRWCKSSASKEIVPRKETSVLFEPVDSKVASENFEARQFPSLAAMALMGKQVTNYRPCEFRKRGSTTIWNI